MTVNGRTKDPVAKLEADKKKRVTKLPDEPEPTPEPVKTNGVLIGAVPKNFPAYYDSLRKAFFAMNGRKEWIEHSEKNLERRLREMGFRRDNFYTNGLTWAEAEILRIVRHNDVVFAGEIAGYDAGLYEVMGQRVLITKTRRKIKRKAGPWGVLKTFLRQLLGKEAIYFHGWLKSSLLALEAGPDFGPGQCLVIAGPAGSGKNLLQALITEALGMREAKPYRYMSGQTTFNGDLFRAEHLVIQDEPASTDIRTRRTFGANIKAFTVNQNQSFHPKGKQAFPLTPFWRLSITLNDNPEHMLVLPPLDADLEGKLTLLRCSKAIIPYEAGDLKGRIAFRQALTKALPGYLAWLEAWKIPQKLQEQRFGIVAYHNPELVDALNDLSPEFRLLQLIDTGGIWDEFCTMLEVTAAELQKLLVDKHNHITVEKHLPFPGSCGSYLGRLADKAKKRVEKMALREGVQYWKIVSPRA